MPALNFAESKNVPVVAIDTGPAGGKAAMVVRADNIRMGADACALTGKALGGKGVRALADGRSGDAERARPHQRLR